MDESRGFERSCLELAQEGEHLCKMGECQAGIDHFRMALQAGTDDLILLSAIYSQMGNAHFYLQQYDKALEYHRFDLQLSSRLNYKIGEAKAYGNISNTLKIIGRFDEAVSCCRRHLNISQDVKDRIGEARALYNLGNIYFAEAKKFISKSRAESESLSKDAKDSLDQAVSHYRANLKIVTDLKDKAAVGRTCGNIGSAFHLLGDFASAVKFHLQRLDIAREFGDKVAERRSYSNLANASVLKGEYKMAADYYRMALDCVSQLGERSQEGHICYSLGNVHSLLGDHSKAAEYYLRHLAVAEEFGNADELSNAYWSLGNAFSQMGETRKALEYARLHLNVSSKLGSVKSHQVALEKLNQFSAELDLKEPLIRRSSSSDGEKFIEDDQTDVGYTRRYRSQRNDSRIDRPINGHASKSASATKPAMSTVSPLADNDQEQFLDWLSEFQSRRMNDQRCSYLRPLSSAAASCLVQNDHDSSAVFNNSLVGLSPCLGGNSSHEKSSESRRSNDTESDRRSLPDEALLNLLINFQSNRYDDQRSPMPSSDVTRDPHEDQQSASAASTASPVRPEQEDSAAASISFPDSTTEGDNPLRSLFSGISKLTGSKHLPKKRK